MVAEMTTYWHKHPPVHILAAGYMGYKPETEIGDAPDLNSAIAAFAADTDDLPEHLRGALDAFVNANPTP